MYCSQMVMHVIRQVGNNMVVLQVVLDGTQGKSSLGNSTAGGGMRISMEADSRVKTVQSANEQGLMLSKYSRRDNGSQGTSPPLVRASLASTSQVWAAATSLS